MISIWLLTDVAGGDSVHGIRIHARSSNVQRSIRPFVLALAAGVVISTPAWAGGYSFSQIGASGYWGYAAMYAATPATDGQTTVLSLPLPSNNSISTLANTQLETDRLVAHSWNRPPYGSPIPDSSVNFSRIGTPSISGGAVAFAGSGGTNADDWQGGIYSNLGGTLKTVASLSTPVPGASGNFTYFDENTVTIRGSAVVFSATDADYKWGVYRSLGGAIERLVHADTAPPAIPPGQAPNAPFGYFSDIDYKNGKLGFQSGSGIFVRNENGSITTVANAHTPIPSDHPDSFASNMWDVNLAGDDVIFKWATQWGVGLYRWNEANGIEAVVDRSAGAPGLGDVVTDLEGNLAFELGGAIYVDDLANPYRRLLGVGDVLAGKTVVAVDMGNQGLGGGTVAFKAYFDDGSAGLFLANPVGAVPEPETYAMMLAGLVLLGLARRRST
jgi:hypothetical protein